LSLFQLLPFLSIIKAVGRWECVSLSWGDHYSCRCEGTMMDGFSWKPGHWRTMWSDVTALNRWAASQYNELHLFVSRSFSSAVLRCDRLVIWRLGEWRKCREFPATHSDYQTVNQRGEVPTMLTLKSLAACRTNDLTSRNRAITRLKLSSKELILQTFTKESSWPEFACELYRPSDRRLSAKLVPTFAGRGRHVVSVTDPYCCIIDFLDRSRYFLIQAAPQL
jgi:hypothetical protein